LYFLLFYDHSDQVAYEIGLSEAIAVYSGVNDIVQAATVYGDTAWGLGSSVNEQVSHVVIVCSGATCVRSVPLALRSLQRAVVGCASPA
jgi:hypothetical protein